MILIGLGLLLCVVGGLWGIVVAFKRSLLWGICYLFVPFAALVFIAVAWSDAKRAFLVNLAGILLLASVLLLPNQGGLALNAKIPLELNQLAPSSVAMPDAVVTVAQVDPMVELRSREQVLRGRKAALNSQDAAAVQALTEDILKYNADLKAATGGPAAARPDSAVAVSDHTEPR